MYVGLSLVFAQSAAIFLTGALIPAWRLYQPLARTVQPGTRYDVDRSGPADDIVRADKRLPGPPDRPNINPGWTAESAGPDRTRIVEHAVVMVLGFGDASKFCLMRTTIGCSQLQHPRRDGSRDSHYLQPRRPVCAQYRPYLRMQKVKKNLLEPICSNTCCLSTPGMLFSAGGLRCGWGEQV